MHLKETIKKSILVLTYSKKVDIFCDKYKNSNGLFIENTEVYYCMICLIWEPLPALLQNKMPSQQLLNHPLC